MDSSLMFSSKNQAWATRNNTFLSIQDKLNRTYNLDPCCVKETAKCDTYITEDMDLFSYDSPEQLFNLVGKESVTMFSNPPYGREQSGFVKHIAGLCSHKGVKADILIPARTDTKLFHEIIYPKASGIKFVEGRITFGSDEYWEWVWSQEIINGKPNSLYGKIGKMNAAPFPSMIVTFGDDLMSSYTNRFNTIKLNKESYERPTRKD